MYDAVTQEFRVPVLIPASASQGEGFATFLREITPEATPVRVFKNDELKNAKKHLTPEEVQQFMAVIDLTKALQNPNDPIALSRAKERLSKVYNLKPEEESQLSSLITEEFSNRVKKDTPDLSLLDALKVVFGIRPSPRALKDERWLLSEVVSEKISLQANLVLWWNGKRFSPAIWCARIVTAFYVRALLNVVGGTGIRICPHCGEIFFQKRSDQDYCSIAHREAHRVARWRAVKTLKSKQKTKRRKNVTHKTR